MSDDIITTDDLALIMGIVGGLSADLAASTASALESRIAREQVISERIQATLSALPHYPSTAQYEHALWQIERALYPSAEVVEARVERNRRA